RVNSSDMLSIINYLITARSSAAPLATLAAEPLAAPAVDSALVLFDLSEDVAEAAAPRAELGAAREQVERKTETSPDWFFAEEELPELADTDSDGFDPELGDFA